MLIQVLAQENLDLLGFVLDGSAESDERWRIANVINAGRAVLRNQGPALKRQVGYQSIDHAPHGFMNQTAIDKIGIRSGYQFKMPAKNWNGRQLVD